MGDELTVKKVGELGLPHGEPASPTCTDLTCAVLVTGVETATKVLVQPADPPVASGFAEDLKLMALIIAVVKVALLACSDWATRTGTVRKTKPGSPVSAGASGG